MTIFHAAILAPLISFVFIIVFGRSAGDKAIAHFSTICALMLGAVYVVSLAVMTTYSGAEPIRQFSMLQWFNFGGIAIEFGLRLDPFSLVALSALGAVSFLVQFYSLRYMSNTPHIDRYFANMSLLTFSMALLIVSTNFVQIVFATHLVSLASFLLIGFRVRSQSAAAAGQRFYILSSIGDLFLLLAGALLFKLAGSFELSIMVSQLSSMFADGYSAQENRILAIAAFLTAAAIAIKSGSFTMHFWLSDSVEAPLPASAFIHCSASSFVGVFIGIRLLTLWQLVPQASLFLIVMGGFAALLTGMMALVQNDIRRIVSLVICSYLGVVVAVIGAGHTAAAMLVWLTSCFLGAALFICISIVSRELGDETDIAAMGGMRSKLPRAHLLALLAAISLTPIGIPATFGGTPIYSSIGLVIAALGVENSQADQFVAGISLFAALLAAIAIWRLFFVVFHGRSRASADLMAHVHDCASVYFVLMSTSIALGWIFSLGLLGGIGKPHWNGDVAAVAQNLPQSAGGLGWLCLLASFGLIALARYLFNQRPSTPKALAEEHDVLHHFLSKEGQFRDFWSQVIGGAVKSLGAIVAHKGDKMLLNNYGILGVASAIEWLSVKAMKLQTIPIRKYVLILAFSLVVIVGYLLGTGV